MQLPNILKTPSLLQKLQWVFDPVSYMENAAQQYPDIFTGRTIGFGDTIVFVHHPQAIQEILTNDRKKFVASGKLNKITEAFAGKNSILMLDGSPHKWIRQLTTPCFHGQRMHVYGELICNLSDKVFSQLPLNQPFLGRDIAQDISLELILQIVLGLHEGERFEKLKHLLPSMLGLFRSLYTTSFFFFPFLQKDLGAWTPWGKFLRDRETIYELLYAEIADRRQKPNSERVDILSLLISAQDETGQFMTDDQLRDQLMSLIIAGYETTATAISWGFYWIYHKPQVREKLFKELDNLGDSPDPMSIYRLPYLTAVCNETLRIHPVSILLFPRVVKEPVELLGHPLEPGTVLLPSVYLAHQREDVYPQHKEFRPERFIERQFSPYEFLPFGGGVRRCMGEALAFFQMKLVLATVLSRYEFALVNQQPERIQRRGFTLAPATGVKMVITGRRVRPEPLAQMTATRYSV